MFVRLFANTTDKSEAISILNNTLASIENKIKSKNITKTEPYWKMEYVYLVESEILFYDDLDSEQINQFMYGIANKWMFFGSPINEALASDTVEGCEFLISGVKFYYIYNLAMNQK